MIAEDENDLFCGKSPQGIFQGIFVEKIGIVGSMALLDDIIFSHEGTVEKRLSSLHGNEPGNRKNLKYKNSVANT
ncbi:hypothetical protein [Bartonella sp. ML70XJBT]|uniref:hypothetical protein n=1 Tax=Bartonella sp. ML70XJBT TaxID=3019096 RepID=UPI00235F931B|nr:hypothetical protein [Bartonella sp. ML70XJBT]